MPARDGRQREDTRGEQEHAVERCPPHDRLACERREQGQDPERGDSELNPGGRQGDRPRAEKEAGVRDTTRVSRLDPVASGEVCEGIDVLWEVYVPQDLVTNQGRAAEVKREPPRHSADKKFIKIRDLLPVEADSDIMASNREAPLLGPLEHRRKLRPLCRVRCHLVANQNGEDRSRPSVMGQDRSSEVRDLPRNGERVTGVEPATLCLAIPSRTTRRRENPRPACSTSALECY